MYGICLMAQTTIPSAKKRGLRIRWVALAVTIRSIQRIMSSSVNDEFPSHESDSGKPGQPGEAGLKRRRRARRKPGDPTGVYILHVPSPLPIPNALALHRRL